MALSETAITIKIGEVFTLSLSTDPVDAKRINEKWISSNPSIAWANGGYSYCDVTGVSKGTTEIYYYCDGKDNTIYEKCLVTVEEQENIPDPPVENNNGWSTPGESTPSGW